MKITDKINEHMNGMSDPSPLEVARALADDIMGEPDRELVREWIVSLALPAVRVHVNGGRADSVKAWRREVSQPGKPGRSKRFERRRSAWARMLDERVLVGGVYKRQGDCTVADLEAAVADRREHVERVRWHVARLESFIAAMNAHGVSTLGELPEGAVDAAVLVAA